MERFEPTSEQTQAAYLDGVLNLRPDVPVGKADVTDFMERGTVLGVNEPGWAWTRLPLWLAEIESTYTNIGNKPIVTLDLCSSVPVYAQRLRYLEFDRDGARARDLIKGFFSGEHIAAIKTSQPAFMSITQALGRDKAARRLLEAGLQESLYEITNQEAAGTHETNPLYGKQLQQKLTTQRKGYTRSDEIHYDHADIRGEKVESIDFSYTYLQRLARLQTTHGSVDGKARKQSAGLEMAERYLAWQVDYMARAIVGKLRYRPARFFSMDSADPYSIASSALANMPVPAQQLEGFSQSIASLAKQSQHLRGNIFEPLPFPDDSLALITCFDGWPFHFQTDPELHSKDYDFGEATKTVLANMYQKLSPGGKMVIFPWAMLGEDYSTTKYGSQTLIEIAAAFGDSVDEPFNLKGVHRNTLYKYMSASDRETSARMSPVFNSPNSHFFALVIGKSQPSSLKALRAKSQVGGLATAAQVQG